MSIVIQASNFRLVMDELVINADELSLTVDSLFIDTVEEPISEDIDFIQVPPAEPSPTPYEEYEERVKAAPQVVVKEYDGKLVPIDAEQPFPYPHFD